MATSNLMDDTLLKVLKMGDSEEFKRLLNSEEIVSPTIPTVAIDMPSELESAGDDSHPEAPQTDPNSTPQGVAVTPMIRSMLLRRVTSAGDGVLHIAARHGHLNLVCEVFDKAGIEANPKQAEEAAREGAREEQEGKSSRRVEDNAAGVAAAAVVVETGGAAEAEAVAAAESPTASSSRHRHGENATQGRRGEEAEIREDEPRLLPAPTGAGDPQQHCDHEEVDAAQVAINFVKLLRAKNHRGETCLHEAVRWGHTMIVRKLIEGDAKLDDVTTPVLVEITDDDGASPLYLATTLRRDDIVKCLTDNAYKYKDRVSCDGPAGKTALHAAVLLSKVDCKDSQGWSPIHAAASRGRLDVVKKLVEKCPNCESSCNEENGQTFLHVAVLNGQAKIVRYVCADPKFAHLLNARDKNGDTALHLAVRDGHEYIFCSLFGNKEICLSFINKQGRTPLDLAYSRIESDHEFKQRKREWIINDLLVAGADFCSCRWDDFSSSGIKKPTDEKESEKLSKSAGLIAAGAALILSMSFAAPFTIANKNLPTVDDRDVSHGIDSAQKRAQSFENLVEFDAFSLTASSLAIFFCMIAGFHTSRAWTRSVALLLGGSFLYVAAEEILMVFAMGLSQVYPRKMAPHVVWFVIIALNVLCLVAAILTLHLRRVIAHVRARCSRLGLLASLGSLFRFPPGLSAIPQWHIALHVALTASWIINTRYLFTSKSMSMCM
ncbi:hypothetical protein BAE44_0024592 [Dichanthelium oligosanthes]|uniref:PGG domain-containing protein n=1 Tax=Dichanthelium oligosanthes TaxID=888268 RepID=A0A1E5UND9_9POAL|nr:hypothetical protein BAE44_0024592 [Dichanthelium oligosanthes]